MGNKSNVISKVFEGSIAEELDIQVGDSLLSINGKEVVDIIDYLFLISDEYLEIEVEKADGEIWDLEIEKDYDEELGIEFSNPILDHARNCSNKCIFCFIDQLPKGMRETLYFKDDDSRLSFLQGNFVTLTNVKEHELDRIIEYNISPINVSIHTTNPELRVKMLNNRFAGNILERLKKLTSNRIEVNGQIVLCPCYNDGAELDRTLEDLYKMEDKLGSLAIVPIGKTKFRDGLAEVASFDKESSIRVINQINKWQEFFLTKMGTRFVFLSDEFYVMAEMDVPSVESYEGFRQIENGVGLMSKFKDELQNAISEATDKSTVNNKKRVVSIGTGASAHEFMSNMGQLVNEFNSDVTVNVYHVENDFFGRTITVAGLLTGTDLYDKLKDKELGDVLLIPKAMLKSNEDIFLDDMTVEQLSEKLNVDIRVVEVEGHDFLLGCLGY